MRAEDVRRHYAPRSVLPPTRRCCPGSRLCPPLWTGIVVLGDAGIVTVPSDQIAELVAGPARKLSPIVFWGCQADSTGQPAIEA